MQLTALPSGAVVMPIAQGDPGTEQTLKVIRQLVEQGKKDPEVNRLACWLVKDVRQFDQLGEIRAVYEWVRRNIRFVRDIEGKETLRTAREILTVRAGDCDDINGILLPSLLGTIGHRCRLVTISSHPQAPEVFSHIYAEVYSAGRWIPLDSARLNPRLGRGPSHFYRKRVWSLSSDEFQDVAGGVGGLGYYTPRLAYAPIGPRFMGQPFDPRRRYLTGPRRLGFDWGQFAVQMSQATSNILQQVLNRPPAIPVYQPPAPAPSSAQLPAWVLPAGLGLAAIFLLRNR